MSAGNQPSDTPANGPPEDDKLSPHIHTGIDTAVLFIHGMGETEPGDSLIRFVHPLVDFLTRWATEDHTAADRHDHIEDAMTAASPSSDGGAATGDASQSPRPERATVVESSTPSPGRVFVDSVDHTLMRNASIGEVFHNPPHTILGLEGPPLGEEQGATSRRNVLFVEAWWESEFAPPAFGDVAKWALGVGPYILARHFTLRPEESNASRSWLVKYTRYLWALLVVLLFDLVIATLLVLSILPYAKNRVRGIILKLIGSFGDVLAYTSGAMRASAVRGSVVRSLKYLQAHEPRRIIVIGYSLGSLVGYDVLNATNARAHTYITFGSPLKKLNVLKQLQLERLRLSGGIGLAMGGLALVVAAIALFVGSGHPLPDLWRAFTAQVAPSATAGWLTAALIFGVLAVLGRFALWIGVPTRLSPTKLIAPIGAALATIAALLGFVLADLRDPELAPGDLLPQWDLGAWPLARVVDLTGAALLGLALAGVAWRERNRHRSDAAVLDTMAPVVAEIDRLEARIPERRATLRQVRACVRACSPDRLRLAGTLARELGDPADDLRARIASAQRQLTSLAPPVRTRPLLRDWPLAILLLTGTTLVLGRIPLDDWSAERHTFVLPALVGAIAHFWSTTRVVSRGRVPDHVPELTVMQAQGIHLLDLWSSADPFTEFGLAEATIYRDPIQMESHEVFNGRNIIRDHTTYEANWEELMGRVASHLLDTVGWEPQAEAQRAQLVPWQRRRRRRVNERLWGTLALIGLATLGPFALGREGLADLWGPLAFINEPINPLLDSFNIPTLPEASSGSAWVAGLVVLWLLLALWYTPVLTDTWSQWDQAEATAFFRGARPVGPFNGRILVFRALALRLG